MSALRPDECAAIAAWSAAGIPQKDIAELLGRSQGMVARYIQRANLKRPSMSQAQLLRRARARTARAT